MLVYLITIIYVDYTQVYIHIRSTLESIPIYSVLLVLYMYVLYSPRGDGGAAGGFLEACFTPLPVRST